MKNTRHFLPLIAMLVLCSSSAFALQIASVGDLVQLTPGLGTTVGGEFYIDVLNKGISRDYISFCVEKYEYIQYSPATFTIGSIEDYAVNGGPGAVIENGISKDYLSDRTKWVYWNYLQGAFSAYGSGDALANDIQRIIWDLEEEIQGYSSPLYTHAKNQQILAIDGVVKVMNLQTLSGREAQSQLIAESPVPEPSTLLLFGTSIAGLAGTLRRRQASF